MGDIDHLPITQLDAGDAAGGLLLSTEAHWNQTEADWEYFLTKGIVFGNRDRKGTVVATAALLPYSETDAWVSMVLVTDSWRRRGLATQLVDTCLNTASKLGVTSFLDATPAGAAVYGPLGFTPTIQLRRLRLANAAGGGTPLPPGKLNEFLTCDISAMGFSRSDLLQELSNRAGSRLISNGDAMALIRDGRTARHVGPLFAFSPAQALALIQDIAASESGPLLLDAVATQAVFLDGLAAAGWTIERSFQRMRFGRATTPTAELPFAVAGPEFG
jgi:GNAT superfamily N-acetyltransferase